MRLNSMARTACLALMLSAPACARNKTNDQVGAAQDSTGATARSDTTTDQTQSGVTDSSGRSTLGKDAQKTRPDQGQPGMRLGPGAQPCVDPQGARLPGEEQCAARLAGEVVADRGGGPHRAINRTLVGPGGVQRDQRR